MNTNGQQVKDIFTLIKDTGLSNSEFLMLLDRWHVPAKNMIEEQLKYFHDPDGNFTEQFQSSGFDARLFELFLNSYFHSAGMKIVRPSAPDFILEKDGARVAVEATTSNPSSVHPMVIAKGLAKFEVAEEAVKNLVKKAEGEVAFRLGGALTSKLKKNYWNLTICKDMPLVLAIEAFHDGFSLLISHHSLANFLYGLEHSATRDNDGNLEISARIIENHLKGSTTIDSHFFSQPGAENVSAVIYSNTGTIGKFNRMGFEAGFDKGDVWGIKREGTAYDPDPQSSTPQLFSYRLCEGVQRESWGEGLVVMLNPNAKYSLPYHFFPNAAYVFMENGILTGEMPQFHPYNSMTTIMTEGK